MDARFYGDRRGGDPFFRYGRPAQHAAPKVVQIPVRFVGSEVKIDRSESATRIQKVFRGFMARKSVRKIREIESEVEAVEVRSKEVDLMDSKQRMRMSESLMSLLLKLDSVTGIDFGVRVLRKAVIRKAIALQERIDAVDSEVHGGAETSSAVGVTENAERSETARENAEEPVSSNEDSLMASEDGVEATKEGEAAAEEEENGDEMSNSGAAAEEKENKRSRELLERMAEENSNMMKMMEQLSERSESQARMLDALNRRVGILEKVFVCDLLRKKKKLASACEIES